MKKRDIIVIPALMFSPFILLILKLDKVRELKGFAIKTSSL